MDDVVDKWFICDECIRLGREKAGGIKGGIK